MTNTEQSLRQAGVSFKKFKASMRELNDTAINELGKSHRISRRFRALEKKLETLQSDLDDAACNVIESEDAKGVFYGELE